MAMHLLVSKWLPASFRSQVGVAHEMEKAVSSRGSQSDCSQLSVLEDSTLAAPGLVFFKYEKPLFEIRMSIGHVLEITLSIAHVKQTIYLSTPESINNIQDPLPLPNLFAKEVIRSIKLSP